METIADSNSGTLTYHLHFSANLPTQHAQTHVYAFGSRVELQVFTRHPGQATVCYRYGTDDGDAVTVTGDAVTVTVTGDAVTVTVTW